MYHVIWNLLWECSDKASTKHILLIDMYENIYLNDVVMKGTVIVHVKLTKIILIAS